MKTTTNLLAILLFVATPAAAQLADLDAGELADGERLFRVHCARCHGMNGAGGEGSNLARARLKYATDDEKLLDILGEGIPGTGMPAIWSLDDEQAKRVAGYVRSLGRIAEEAMPGDPERGRQVYDSRGGCPACHIVAGHGKGIGPELTWVGDQRGLDYLRQSLTEPAASQAQTMGYRDYLTVRVRAKSGEIEGLRINEDAFSIQVRDVGGVVHSFRKDELLGYEKIFAHSLMPAYDGALSAEDIDDVVSYLMSLRKTP